MCEEYGDRWHNWIEVRSMIANKLNIPFSINELSKLAEKFYKSMIKEPLFTCRYIDNNKEILCNNILFE